MPEKLKSLSIEVSKDTLLQALQSGAHTTVILERDYGPDTTPLRESLRVERFYTGGGVTLTISRGPRETKESQCQKNSSENCEPKEESEATQVNASTVTSTEP